MHSLENCIKKVESKESYKGITRRLGFEIRKTGKPKEFK
jgi:hypothetical protein